MCHTGGDPGAVARRADWGKGGTSVARTSAKGLDSMKTSTEVAEKIAEGEYEESRPSRAVKISTDPDAGARDTAPPFLSILQGQSKAVQQKKGQPGQFMIRNFPALDTITLIPLGLGNFREY